MTKRTDKARGILTVKQKTKRKIGETKTRRTIYTEETKMNRNATATGNIKI